MVENRFPQDKEQHFRTWLKLEIRKVFLGLESVIVGNVASVAQGKERHAQLIDQQTRLNCHKTMRVSSIIGS